MKKEQQMFLNIKHQEDNTIIGIDNLEYLNIRLPQDGDGCGYGFTGYQVIFKHNNGEKLVLNFNEENLEDIKKEIKKIKN